jgi:hypothetical protein
MEGGERVGSNRAGGAERSAEFGAFWGILGHLADCAAEGKRAVGLFRAGARAGGWKGYDTETQRRRGGSWVCFADLMLMGRVGVVWKGLARGRSCWRGLGGLGFRGA